MKEVYKVWIAFGVDSDKFYVVNSETSKIQSAWKDYIIAKKTCGDLNLMLDRDRKVIQFKKV